MPEIIMKKSASEDIAELQKRANLFIDALQFLSEKKAACELAKQEINAIRQFCALACKSYGAKCDQILNERQYSRRYWDTFKTQDRALFNAIPISKEGKPVVMSQDHKVPIYLYEVSAPQKKAQGFWMLLIGALSSTDTDDAYKKQFFSWDNGSTLKISFLRSCTRVQRIPLVPIGAARDQKEQNCCGRYATRH